MKEEMVLTQVSYKPGILVVLLLLILVVGACATASGTGETPLQTVPEVSPQKAFYTYRIVEVYPHQKDAFTQGLVYENGVLYEGTGLYGQSSLRKVELETGQVLSEYELPEAYFGEGIAVLEDRIIQLTWKARKGFVYNKGDFSLLGEFAYPTEGWGITHNGETLFMSDGTSTIYTFDPQSLEITGSVQVRDDGIPVDRLNELEYIDNRIYANVWQTDRIAVIRPEDGVVTGWIDLSGLLRSQNFKGKADVLNGIAWDAAGNRLFVTGKLWPYLFEIELAPGPQNQ